MMCVVNISAEPRDDELLVEIHTQIVLWLTWRLFLIGYGFSLCAGYFGTAPPTDRFISPYSALIVNIPHAIVAEKDIHI